MDEDWMEKGNCRRKKVDMFPSHSWDVPTALAVCTGCPVKGVCLDYALRNRIDHGVWGGASERERKRLAKVRRIAS